MRCMDDLIVTDPEGPGVERINAADRCALEEALLIGEKDNRLDITAVMAGPPGHEWVLEGCCGFKIDRAVYLSVTDWEPMDSYVCAAILRNYIEELEPDLILCGDYNSDFESGQVGSILSELLKVPHVSGVVDLTMTSDRTGLEIERKLMRGNRLNLKVSFPLVISVDTAANQPRYISLHNRIKSSLEKPVSIIAINKDNHKAMLDTSTTQLRVLNIGPVRVRPKKTALPSSAVSAKDRLDFMMTGGDKSASKKNNNIVDGSTEIQVDTILDFLKTNLS